MSLVAVGAGLTGCASGPHADRHAALTTVQSLFNAMAEKDAEAAKRLLVEGGAVVDVRQAPDAPSSTQVRTRTHEEFAQGLPAIEPPILERMWSPTVKVEGDLAMVWTPYDFWIDNELSHCGIDVFTLVRTDEGWRIATITYSVRTEDCEDSPLGPPRGARRARESLSRTAR